MLNQDSTAVEKIGIQIHVNKIMFSFSNYQIANKITIYINSSTAKKMTF